MCAHRQLQSPQMSRRSSHRRPPATRLRGRHSSPRPRCRLLRRLAALLLHRSPGTVVSHLPSCYFRIQRTTSTWHRAKLASRARARPTPDRGQAHLRLVARSIHARIWQLSRIDTINSRYNFGEYYTRCCDTDTGFPSIHLKSMRESELRALVHLLQEVEERARAPRLRVARVSAIFAVFVRELGNPTPRVVADVAACREQERVQVVESLRRILSHSKLACRRSHARVSLTVLPPPNFMSK